MDEIALVGAMTTREVYLKYIDRVGIAKPGQVRQNMQFYLTFDPHEDIVFNTGSRDFPRVESLYSTRGGTSG